MAINPVNIRLIMPIIFYRDIIRNIRGFQVQIHGNQISSVRPTSSGSVRTCP